MNASSDGLRARRSVVVVMVAVTAITLGLVAAVMPSPARVEAAADWSMQVGASPDTVAAGGRVTFTLHVVPKTRAAALADIEVYDGSGSKAFQFFWDTQLFTAGRPRLFTTTWDIPATTAPGTYTVTAGIFRSGWGQLFAWNNNATTITITPPGQPTTTTSTSTTSTTAPTTTVAPTTTTTTTPTTTTTTTTTTAPTTTAAPTTTTAPSTTSAPPTTAPPAGLAYREAFDAAAAVTSRNGPLPTDRFSVARWRQEHYPGGHPDTQGNGPALPNDVRYENGRLVVESGMQNYGDTLVRVNQPFAGTRIEFDAQINTANGNAQLLLADRPYTVPSFLGENGNGPHMDNGWGLYWQGNGCPLLRRWVNGVQTDHYGDGRGPGPYSCLGPMPSITPGVLNHVRIDLTSTALTVTIDGSLVGSYPASPIAEGYVMFGVHNHASQKYGSGPVAVSAWDNLTWNGAVRPLTRVAQVPNAGTTYFGWSLNQSGQLHATSPLALSGATQAWLLVDAGANVAVSSSARLRYRLNDGATHEVPFQTANRPAGSAGSTTFSIPIAISELVNGTNTVRLTATGINATNQPDYANIDIVVRP